MNWIIQNCIINTDKSYIKITYSDRLRIYESVKDDCFYINIPKGFRWSDIVHHKLSLINDQLISETDYIKLTDAVYNLNGLVFRKLLPTDYVFSQYLIKDLDDHVMLYDNFQCQILVPIKDNFNIDKYIKLIKLNPYLELIEYNSIDIKNLYAINLSTKSVSIRSSNEFSFNTKKYYTKYILSAVDIHESFISQLRDILKTYGCDLLTLPIQDNTNTVDYVTYRYTDLDKQETHKTGFYPLKREVKKVSRIDFELTTPNLVLLEDFKSKYQNLDFLSDFTTFQTLDKLNNYWSSECRWGPLSTDFNQDYEQDQQGNRAFRVQFNCELYYYVVYDDQYYEIQSIILKLMENKNKFNIIEL